LRPPKGVRRGRRRSVGRWDTALGGAHGASGRRCSVGGPILRAASPTATPPLPEKRLCRSTTTMYVHMGDAPFCTSSARRAKPLATRLTLSLTCVSLTHSPIDGWRSGDLKNSNPRAIGRSNFAQSRVNFARLLRCLIFQRSGKNNVLVPRILKYLYAFFKLELINYLVPIEQEFKLWKFSA